MSTEHAIILMLNGLLFALCALVVGILLHIALFRLHKREPPGKMTDDCAEFYLDLHRYATDVDFTEEEAQALYNVWQRWIGKKYNVRALVAEKRDESNNKGGN